MSTPATSFARILVAVDGSAHALDATRIAARLAAALGARLTLLTVYHPPSDTLGEPNYSEALATALEGADRVLEEARRAVQLVGGPTPAVERLGGPPAEVIVGAARDGEHDLVVMGTRGLGRLGSALLGSVSSEVAARAGRPVMISGGAD
jgi:nucleotide-binding universal stress UspA family protein